MVTPVYEQSPITSMASDAQETIILNCGETGIKLGETKDQATSFWFVLAPVVFETGFSVVLTNAKNDEIIISTSNKIIIERNTVKPMAELEITNPKGVVGILKEEAPMTNDEKVYVIGGGEITS